MGPDGLDEGQIRDRGVTFVAAPDQDLGAPNRGVGGGLLADAGLADAGLPDHHDQRTAAAHRCVNRGAQSRHLRLPAHKAPGRPGTSGGARRGRSDAVGRLDSRQPRFDVRSARRAVVGRLGQEIHDQRLQPSGDLGVEPGRQHGAGIQVLGDHRHRVLAEERRPPGEHLVQNRTERVEIAPGIRLAPHRLLRRHVSDGAEHHPLDGDPGSPPAQRQPEVPEQGAALGIQPHVGRLEVPVHDAEGVSVLERPAHISCHRHDLSGRQTVIGRGVETLGQRAAGHVLAHHDRCRSRLDYVEDRDHVGVVTQAGHGPSLLPRPRQRAVVETFGLERGHCHLPAQTGIGGAVDELPGPFAEEGRDGVATLTERFRQGPLRCGHRAGSFAGASGRAGCELRATLPAVLMPRIPGASALRATDAHAFPAHHAELAPGLVLRTTSETFDTCDARHRRPALSGTGHRRGSNLDRKSRMVRFQ